MYPVWKWTAPCYLLCGLLFTLANSAGAGELQVFATDGCSEFPDGTWHDKTLWLDCCIAHDVAYWLGGSYQQRKAADENLKVCVAEIGQPEIAAVMLAGVRVGGSPFWPTRYRWGYGWPYWDGFLPRGYRDLSEEEKEQAGVLLPPELADKLLN